MAVIALVFFIRRKNKQGGKNNSNSNQYEQHKNNESELLEVDWDKIDNQYKEMQLPPQQQYINHQQAYVSRHSMADDYHSEPTEGSSTKVSTQVPDVYRQSIDTARHTAISSPDVSEGRSTPSVVSPDVAVSPMVMRIVKPDAGP